MVRRVVLFLAVIVVVTSAYHAAAQAAANATIASIDWDSNGTSDATIWRTSDGKLYVLQGPAFNTAFAITSASATAKFETLLPGLDYNGDGKIDFGTFRQTLMGSAAPAGQWTFMFGPTFQTASAVSWGTAGDVPLPADWDGNGAIDLAVWRSGERKLFVLQGPNFDAAFSVTWGVPGNVAMPGDYDGDGRIDFAVFNAGDRAVYVLQGGTNYTTAFKISVGAPGQIPIPGDFDGDGRLDIAMVIPGASGIGGNTWIVAQGGNSFNTLFSRQWGITGDTLVPGDYDGDGKLDIATFRPSENRVFVLQQGTTNKYSTAFALPPWGIAGAGDIAVGQVNTKTLP